MDFIFMLTRQDRTVGDCLAVLELVAPLGLGHVGFKDIGADLPTLRQLAARIRALGGVSYLEVVATDKAASLRSAEMAMRIGVDRLLGGTEVAATLGLIAGSGISYFPFPGLPSGHPTSLAGDAARVREDCRRFVEMGCAGADLLAYRATEAEPLDLVRAARDGLGDAGTLICAGGIDAPDKIRALRDAGCDAFTVGSAAFDARFAAGDLPAQLQTIAAAADLPRH